MTFATLLINSCQFERWTDSGASGFGNQTKVYANHLAVQPCRLSKGGGGGSAGSGNRERQDATEVTQTDRVLFCNDIDVTEHDRVTVDGVVFEIVYVETKQGGVADHHKELDLVRVKV